MEMENLSRSGEEINWELSVEILHQYPLGMSTSSLQSPGHKGNSDFLMFEGAGNYSGSNK